MKHANIALFVPHAGCPHQCSFCNQRRITGEAAGPSAEDVRKACDAALISLGERARGAEIAFFGGSFTAIRPAYRRELLEAAYPYIKAGAFGGIRISTRPDAVSGEILEELKQYGVTAIELGAQSMEDSVLALNERGHSAEDVVRASAMIREAGFSLGLQMMTGLYGSAPEMDRRTAARLIALGPDTARIYPTLVLSDTPLATFYLTGTYRPQPLEEVVELCAGLLQAFERAGVSVIRMGLHAAADLQQSLLAGPFHPAFRELCESRLMLREAFSRIQPPEQGEKHVALYVHPRALSRMIGQKRQNLAALAEQHIIAEVKTDPALAGLAIRIEE